MTSDTTHAGDSNESESLVGKVLDSRFKLDAVIGQGATSVVYAGEHKFMHKPVAIKIMRSAFTDDDDSLRRFRREIIACRDLHHPNIVHVFASGSLSDGRPYFVMDKLSGRSLANLLYTEKRLPWRRVIVIALSICDALSFAHKRGILHRDIKPSNIVFVSQDPTDNLVRVVDFGLARFIDDKDSRQNVTATGASIAGSPPYMSPEQCRSENLDPRSDIYSLCCLMYECLSGNPPFSGATPLEIMYKHEHETATVLKASPDIPDSLSAIVSMGLSKDPESRYQTMNDLSRDLKCCLDNLALPSGAKTSKSSLFRVLTTLVSVKTLAVIAAAMILLPLAGTAYGALTYRVYDPRLVWQLVLDSSVGGHTELEAINSLAARAFKNKRYTESSSLYKAALDLTLKLFRGKKGGDLAIADADQRLGDSYLASRDESYARIYYNDGIENIYPYCNSLEYSVTEHCKTDANYFQRLHDLISQLPTFTNSVKLAKAWVLCAQYYNASGRPQEADECCRNAVNIYKQLSNDSASMEAYCGVLSWQGEVYLQQKQWGKAIEIAQREYAVRLKSYPPGNYALAATLLREGIAQVGSGLREIGLATINQSVKAVTNDQTDKEDINNARAQLSFKAAAYFCEIGQIALSAEFFQDAANYYRLSPNIEAPMMALESAHQLTAMLDRQGKEKQAVDAAIGGITEFTNHNAADNFGLVPTLVTLADILGRQADTQAKSLFYCDWAYSLITKHEKEIMSDKNTAESVKGGVENMKDIYRTILAGKNKAIRLKEESLNRVLTKLSHKLTPS